jgi:hypothetical protein
MAVRAIGSSALGSRLRAIVPWLTSGLLLGRPIVPSLPWVWTIAFIFFLINLLLNVVFDAPVRASAATLRATPLSAFLTGLLVMLLAGPVCMLLAVSVVGIAVLPFLLCAMLIAVVLGKIAFARWLGMSVLHQDEPENRFQSFRSFLIGSAIMCVAYMIPVLGFVTWALAGVFGLGAATQAFFSAYRRENPKQPKKVKVVTAPPAEPSGPSGPSEPSVAYATPVASAFSADVPRADPLYSRRSRRKRRHAPASDLVILPRAASSIGSPGSPSTSSSSPSPCRCCRSIGRKGASFSCSRSRAHHLLDDGRGRRWAGSSANSGWCAWTAEP